MKKSCFALFIFLFVIVSGCALLTAGQESLPTFKTVEYEVNDPQFQAQNLPIRKLQVAVIMDEPLLVRDIYEGIAGASALLREQVGVELEIVSIEKKQMNFSKPDQILEVLRQERRAHPDIDIVVGYVDIFSCLEEKNLKRRLCLEGETVEWRNIWIRNPQPNIVAHEVGHTFMPSHMHSPRGLMMAINCTQYLTESDRAMILRNKWRNFRKRGIIESCFGFC